MISTKARYSLRVMVDLAQHQEETYVPLKEIAKRQKISEKYLEIILKILVKGKIVKGLRGKGGGYPYAKRIYRRRNHRTDRRPPFPGCLFNAGCRNLSQE